MTASATFERYRCPICFPLCSRWCGWCALAFNESNCDCSQNLPLEFIANLRRNWELLLLPLKQHGSGSQLKVRLVCPRTRDHAPSRRQRHSRSAVELQLSSAHTANPVFTRDCDPQSMLGDVFAVSKTCLEKAYQVQTARARE